MNPTPSQPPSPPQWPDRLLNWLVAPHLREEVLGDLHERYFLRVQRVGAAQARLRYGWEVLAYLQPAFIKRQPSEYSQPECRTTFFLRPNMIRNYLKIARRSLLKNKVSSGINLLGLVVGITACLLILQYVSFELSFDQFQTDGDRIYRVTNDRFQQGRLVQHGTITYPTIGPTMAKDYPEVEASTMLFTAGRIKLRRENAVFPEEQSLFVDEHFLPFFTFPLLVGDPKTALKAPNSLVLSETNARRIFGVGPADYAKLLGQSLRIDRDTEPYRITGILRDVPAASHLQFGALISYETLVKVWGSEMKTSWNNSSMWHYLKLRPGGDAAALERKFPAFSERYFKGDKVSGSVEKFYLQPLRRAHLYSDYPITSTKSGSSTTARRSGRCSSSRPSSCLSPGSTT